MKKLLLAATVLAFGVNANAQQTINPTGTEPTVAEKTGIISPVTHAVPGVANKATGLTAPFTLATDSMYSGTAYAIWADYAQPLDSGYFYGTNVLGDKGFAHLYNLNFDASGNNDTTITVVGFLSKWAGRIQPASSKMVTFSIWSRGTDKTLRAGHSRYYIYGKPSALLASQSVKDTTLKTTGSFTVTALTTPLANQSSSVYVGVTIPYTWTALAADTFGLRSTSVAGAEVNYYTLSSGDSLLSANNLIQGSNNTWVSPFFERTAGGVGDAIVAPIVSLSCPKCSTGINGIQANNLTFYGNYPNPANNATNVKFALAKATNVSISLLDNTGRLINTINAGSLSVGEHIVPMTLNNLSSGQYIYAIETADGDRIAAQFTVAK